MREMLYEDFLDYQVNERFNAWYHIHDYGDKAFNEFDIVELKSNEESEK